MGLDEVGRGCLAGPVVAAGVIITSDSPLNTVHEIQDSKAIKESIRVELAEEIKAKAEFWTIKHCSINEIDDLNILWASIRAMEKCVEEKGAAPDYLLVDGNRFSPSLIPHSCLVKGDDRSQSIAAASILAKVERDQLMKNLHEKYPEFGWDSNVGYPTVQHRNALKDHGITPHHRKSFKLGTDKSYK
ncbi:ribonuclease HII [Balneola sp. MJW-20]|uniref:ribonuclease HII n=1 Tax=Gracilimonas aurantiaca TaxID=3234185 RepID=UPI00346734A3